MWWRWPQNRHCPTHYEEKSRQRGGIKFRPVETHDSDGDSGHVLDLHTYTSWVEKHVLFPETYGRTAPEERGMLILRERRWKLITVQACVQDERRKILWIDWRWTCLPHYVSASDAQTTRHDDILGCVQKSELESARKIKCGLMNKSQQCVYAFNCVHNLLVSHCLLIDNYIECHGWFFFWTLHHHQFNNVIQW